MQGWSTGAAALVTVIIIATSSLAHGASPLKTIRPPYSGVVSEVKAPSATGCNTTATIPQHWRFHLSSGTANALETGRAVNACPRTYGGSHPFSQASTSSGFSALIDIGKLATGTTQITANLSGMLTIYTSVWDGGTFVCAKGLFSSLDNNTYEEWNYRTGPSGGYYANWYSKFSERYNGVWSNSTSSQGTPPSPFPTNKNTYYSHLYLTEKYGFCEAVVTSYYDAYALLLDRATGIYTNVSGTSWPASGYVEEELFNDTDFGFENKTTWDGTVSNWTNASGWYTLNQSGFFTSNYTYPQANSSSWFQTSLYVRSPQNLYNNTTVVRFGGDTAFFNQSFAASHRYAIKVFFQVDQTAWTSDYGYANNGWRNAYAYYLGDASTKGNGVHVISIQER
jgi:hypothetical protein